MEIQRKLFLFYLSFTGLKEGGKSFKMRTILGAGQDLLIWIPHRNPLSSGRSRKNLYVKTTTKITSRSFRQISKRGFLSIDMKSSRSFHQT
jgi:hypothetical protein